jgi:hypothetical protein
MPRATMNPMIRIVRMAALSFIHRYRRSSISPRVGQADLDAIDEVVRQSILQRHGVSASLRSTSYP